MLIGVFNLLLFFIPRCVYISTGCIRSTCSARQYSLIDRCCNFPFQRNKMIIISAFNCDTLTWKCSPLWMLKNSRFTLCLPHVIMVQMDICQSLFLLDVCECESCDGLLSLIYSQMLPNFIYSAIVMYPVVLDKENDPLYFPWQG